MRALAWEKCGILRSGEELQAACNTLEADRLVANSEAGLNEFCLRNIHTVALLIARSALARRESRGAHFRTDFPEKQAAFEKHSIIRKGDEVRFE